jgi:hypothetical protein
MQKRGVEEKLNTAGYACPSFLRISFEGRMGSKESDNTLRNSCGLSLFLLTSLIARHSGNGDAADGRPEGRGRPSSILKEMMDIMRALLVVGRRQQH